MVKYILVIKGVPLHIYEAVKEDLAKQYQAKEIESPIFCHLPGDYAEIEVVWIDEEMEKYHFSTTVNRQAESTERVNS